MADDQFDKSEDATPHKLREARKKGQVSKSTELPSFFSLLAMMIATLITLSAATGIIIFEMEKWLTNADYLANDPFALSSYFKSLLTKLGYIAFPVVTAGLIAAIIANIIHVGPLFTLFPVKPDFTKINPAKGLKKIFSRRALVELLKLIVKLLLFAGVTYLVFKHMFKSILTSNHADVFYVLNNWTSAFSVFVFSMLVVFLVSAVFDLWYSKKDFARQMKMSKRDVRDEHKRQEGDPEIKSKRKKKLAELLNTASSTQKIKDSDVIITNPTHFAVALKYRSNSMSLPIVVSKGRGVIASIIKRRATKHGIPIFRKPSLARALVKNTKLGDTIPLDEQVRVAEVYRWVLSIPGNKVNDI